MDNKGTYLNSYNCIQYILKCYMFYGTIFIGFSTQVQLIKTSIEWRHILIYNLINAVDFQQSGNTD